MYHFAIKKSAGRSRLRSRSFCGNSLKSAASIGRALCSVLSSEPRKVRKSLSKFLGSLRSHSQPRIHGDHVFQSVCSGETSPAWKRGREQLVSRYRPRLVPLICTCLWESSRPGDTVRGDRRDSRRQGRIQRRFNGVPPCPPPSERSHSRCSHWVTRGHFLG